MVGKRSRVSLRFEVGGRMESASVFPATRSDATGVNGLAFWGSDVGPRLASERVWSCGRTANESVRAV